MGLYSLWPSGPEIVILPVKGTESVCEWARLSVHVCTRRSEIYQHVGTYADTLVHAAQYIPPPAKREQKSFLTTGHGMSKSY